MGGNEMKKILVVDDEQVVRSLIKKALETKYQIIEADDGVKAIEWAHKVRPDIILMDIIMPKTDGYSACYEIKNDPTTKDIPVIMVTALGQELNNKLANQMGADAYLTKPFRPKQVRDAVSKLLRPNKTDQLELRVTV